MATEHIVVPGIVEGGMVVPQNDTPLPEGARVDIVVGPAAITSELKAEFAAWDKAGDEAWSLIDQWESEEP